MISHPDFKFYIKLGKLVFYGFYDDREEMFLMKQSKI